MVSSPVPGTRWNWVFKYPGPNPEVDQLICTTGAVLAGRRSYDVGKKPGNPPETRKVFGGAWTGPQFVLTHRPPNVEDDPTITFLSGDIGAAIARARTAALGKNVNLIGGLDRPAIHRCRTRRRNSRLRAPSCSETEFVSSAVEARSASNWKRSAPHKAGKLTNLRFRVTK